MNSLVYPTKMAIAILVIFYAELARADSMDDAEAKRRGVAVEVVELEHLKQTNAELQSQLTKLRAENTAIKKQLANAQSLLSAAMPKPETSPSDEIRQAIKNHEVAVGMTLDDVNSLAERPGFMTGQDGDIKHFNWPVRLHSGGSDPSRLVLFNVHGDVEGGKLVAFTKDAAE